MSKNERGKTMDDIFEIVSSYIPDEQKADVKAQIDGELANGKKKILKEISSEYKIDFFQSDLGDQLAKKEFVDKGKLEEYKNKVKEYEEMLTTTNQELEKFKIDNEDYTKLKSAQSLYDSQLELISNGLRVDRLELVKPHLSGDKELDLKNVKEKYPELFKGGQREGRMFPTNDDENLTEAQKYFKMQAEKAKK
jgi:predicted methyltransferase